MDRLKIKKGDTIRIDLKDRKNIFMIGYANLDADRIFKNDNNRWVTKNIKLLLIERNKNNSTVNKIYYWRLINPKEQ